MKCWIAGMLIATGLGFCADGSAQQDATAGAVRTYDVAAGFAAIRANTEPAKCGCFYLYGGNAQAIINLPSPFSVVADVGYAKASNINGSGEHFTLSTYQGGLRYSEVYRDKWKPYAQGLFGLGHLESNFRLNSQNFAFAYTAGIGVDYLLSRRFAVRVVQAEYLGTQFPNGDGNRQGQVRLEAGMVYHLSKRY